MLSFWINASLIFPPSPAPSKHIEGLYSRWESSLDEAKDLKAQLQAQADAHKAELQQRDDAARDEAQGRIQDAVEKARLEG